MRGRTCGASLWQGPLFLGCAANQSTTRGAWRISTELDEEGYLEVMVVHRIRAIVKATWAYFEGKQQGVLDAKVQ